MKPMKHRAAFTTIYPALPQPRKQLQLNPEQGRPKSVEAA